VNGNIPHNPAWCSRCIEAKAPCDDHRGPGGESVPYTGPDVYAPSAWVKQVVGGRYRDGWTLKLCVCFGYDPRHGFWMRQLDTGVERNVSERAIDRTYHRIHMTGGAWMLARAYVALGRMPTPEDKCGADIAMASRTLRDFDCLTADGQLTDAGRKLAAMNERDMLILDSPEAVAS
jgi:hypothetical protein